MINDYYYKTQEEANRDNSIAGDKHEIYEDVIEALVNKNGKRLYDAIGLQSHMHGGPWKTEKILSLVKRFAKYGVPLHFTETTIVSGPRDGRNWGETTPEGEKTQADEVERFYRTVFSCPEVEALTWWDFSDRYAWQQAPSGLLRKDMTPKPAYSRLHKLIKEEWWTNETEKTDAQGTACLRGFMEIIKLPSRQKMEKPSKQRFVSLKMEKTLRALRLFLNKPSYI